jgi:hypothetical protein
MAARIASSGDLLVLDDEIAGMDPPEYRPARARIAREHLAVPSTECFVAPGEQVVVTILDPGVRGVAGHEHLEVVRAQRVDYTTDDALAIAEVALSRGGAYRASLTDPVRLPRSKPLREPVQRLKFPQRAGIRCSELSQELCKQRECPVDGWSQERQHPGRAEHGAGLDRSFRAVN